MSLKKNLTLSYTLFNFIFQYYKLDLVSTVREDSANSFLKQWYR